MIPRCTLLLSLLVAVPVDAPAAKYSSAAQIRDACTKPVPEVVSDRLHKYLQESDGAVASMPKVTCIAILFGDSRDRILSFKPSPDRSYFLTRTTKPSRRQPAYEMSQTPVNFARKLAAGWQIRRWEFENPEFRIAEGQSLAFRRVDAEPKGVLDRQTIRVVRSFPITRSGQLVERLFLLVDDWGQWRSPDKPAERKWHIYSERANAVLLHSVLYTEGGRGPNWDSASIRTLVYMKGTEFDLMVNAEQLAPLRAYMDNFQVWAVE
ncbi:MAG: hypothetical protein QNK18_03500 [Gammaproteobacteria bacterium]|nr:hypothetical protein [Gammaproteobacteria bacterium]